MIPRLKVSALLVLILGSFSCGSSPPPVSLEGQWPNSAGEYDDVTEAWTRSGKLIAPFSDGMSKLLQVSATFHSPEWRRAYVDFRSKREMLADSSRAELLAAQQAADEKFYEVMLLVQTHSFRENDLQKGKRSVWRLALVDAGGNEVEPTEVKSVRTPREYMRPYYPLVTEQDELYVARFPKEGLQLFGGGAKQFSLKMASSKGGVELIWRAR